MQINTTGLLAWQLKIAFSIPQKLTSSSLTCQSINFLLLRVDTINRLQLCTFTALIRICFYAGFLQLAALLWLPAMRRSIRKFNIPLGNPPGIWTFKDWLVQIPSPRGKKSRSNAPPISTELSHSSKAIFVFDRTLYSPFRERCAVITPSNFF